MVIIFWIIRFLSSAKCNHEHKQTFAMFIFFSRIRLRPNMLSMFYFGMIKMAVIKNMFSCHSWVWCVALLFCLYCDVKSELWNRNRFTAIHISTNEWMKPNNFYNKIKIHRFSFKIIRWIRKENFHVRCPISISILQIYRLI